MNANLKSGRAILAIAAGAGAAVVVATGLLTIVLALIAMTQGYGLVELYLATFPTYRGGPHALQIPPIVYGLFYGSVIGAAELAILCRRGIAKRLGTS